MSRITLKLTLVTSVVVGIMSVACAEEPPRKPVSAPYADHLVKQTMATHSELKFIGLHVTPPGEADNLIIACSNPAKIGLVSTDKDMVFAQPKQAKVFSKPNRTDREVDLWFGDSADQTLGMLVIHFDSPEIGTDDAALQRAQLIEQELQKQISSREQLFERK